MLVHFGIDLIRPEWEDSVVCIGTFDGVHYGHRALISRAVELARESQTVSALVTFDRHPAATLAPERTPTSLGTLEQNVQLFRSLGVSICVILPFDRAMSQTPAEEFLQRILIDKLRAKQLVVGHDFAMGKDRQGDSEWLKSRIGTEILQPVTLDGVRVSSSEIREAVRDGHVDRAARLLTRPYALRGIVVRGLQLGRTLGFPTINLARSGDQTVPGDGVYAGRTVTPHGTFLAAINVGVRPVLGGMPRIVEAYLLDYPGDDLYGAPVEIQFVDRIRDEEPLPDLVELQKRIALDVEEVRKRVTLSELS